MSVALTDALDFDVATPVIAQSAMSLVKSRDQNRIAEEAIFQIRHEVGGHPFGQGEQIAAERHQGKVERFYQFGLKEDAD